ncbi:MAG: hypothetical protein AB1Z67_08700 [Candidatus Limnocylindrales bacterium]
MRIDPTHHGSRAPGPPHPAKEQPGAAQLIAELQGAGLIAVEIDEDGDMSFALTPRGRRTAGLMAMSRDGHALVLLGALVGTENGPN